MDLNMLLLLVLRVWLVVACAVVFASSKTPPQKQLSLDMAWRCSALTNEGLVENLARAGIVQSQRVRDAMKAVDRAKYMAAQGPVDPRIAYMDSPQPIGHQQTISAPHMHAYALQLADSAIDGLEAPKILDVGAGSGYLTACLGRMVEARGGRVIGIERIPELVSMASKNVNGADGDLIEKGVVSIQGKSFVCTIAKINRLTRAADGWQGLPNDGPFHFIHVGAAAEETPQALMRQLSNGGKLVVPVGPHGGAQVLLEIQREGQSFKERKLMDVSYVPLVRDRTEL
ncbi:TPA: hypothetical protein N0F65_008304 [Lagenidium giganteum]|uniref:Protein-L-isoaspartate O-methyltransferase n=1 Tax=Lagenidium giganteum TaxID=4803 RepID=A0AAV2YPX6_9STRA|nr:TPA: hypothetical protein N0F65_008304 [Lagenidium giganteum]